MENKKLKSEKLHAQGLLDNNEKNREESYSMFNDESLKTTKESWWIKLLLKIFLPHKNKFVDKLLDLGCFLTLFVVIVGVVYVFMWVFDLVKILINWKKDISVILWCLFLKKGQLLSQPFNYLILNNYIDHKVTTLPSLFKNPANHPTRK